ncbi:hypothetical protein PENTCL1PPCAC_7981, partial [Pristionchus entomophagus]
VFTDAIDVVFDKRFKSLEKKVDKIIDYINRREGRELTQRNCVEKLTETMVAREAQDHEVDKKLEQLNAIVRKAVKHLPSGTQEFDYNLHGMSLAKVQLCETDSPDFIVLGARLSDLLFPDQITLSFKERDPERILWMTQCIIRRRKWEISADITKNMALIRSRIDDNARSTKRRIANGLHPVNRLPKHTNRDQGGKFAKKTGALPAASIPFPSTIVPPHP